MIQKLPESAERVQQFIRERSSEAEVVHLPESTSTAKDAAVTLNVSVSQIGKSIAFLVDSSPVVVVLCGDYKVDTEALRKFLNAKEVASMKPSEVKQITGFPIGGVCPFALPESVKIIVDRKLHDLPECFVAAGHPQCVVRTRGPEIIGLSKGIVGEVSSKIS